MDGLFPIIRRKRRPLAVEGEAVRLPVAVPQCVPHVTVAVPQAPEPQAPEPQAPEPREVVAEPQVQTHDDLEHGS